MIKFLKKCCRRKVVLGVVLMLLLFLLGLSWTEYFATKDLELSLERIRSSRSPIHRSQVVPSLSREENAENLYKKVFVCYQSDEYHVMMGVLGTAFDQLIHKSEWALTDKEKNFLDEHEEISRFLIQASEKKGCVYDSDWGDNFATALPHLSEIDAPLEFALLQTFRLAMDGQYEKSQTLLKASLALSRSVEKDPAIISYLIEISNYRKVLRTAFLMYQQFPLMRPSIRELFETQRPKLKELFIEKLKAERVFLIETFFDMLKNRYSIKDIVQMFSSSSKKFSILNVLEYCPLWMLAPGLKLDFTYILKGYEQMFLLLESPSWVALHKMKDFRRTYWNKAPFYAVCSKLSGIDLSNNFEVHLNMVAQEELFFLGLHLYDAAPGEVPFSGDFEQFAKEVHFSNEDPFTGKPYLIKREGNSLFIYSVGENLKDDQAMFVESMERYSEAWDTGWNLVWNKKVKFAPLSDGSLEEGEEGEEGENSTAVVPDKFQVPKLLQDAFNESQKKYAQGNYTDAIFMLQSALRMTVTNAPLEMEEILNTWSKEHQERLQLQIKLFLEQENLLMAKSALDILERLSPKENEILQTFRQTYQEKNNLVEQLKQQRELWVKAFSTISIRLKNVQVVVEDQTEKKTILIEFSREGTQKNYSSENGEKAREICRQLIIGIIPTLPQAEQDQMIKTLFSRGFNGAPVELGELLK